MEGHARTWFTPKQKTELWERWKSGQCVGMIGLSAKCQRRIFNGDARCIQIQTVNSITPDLFEDGLPGPHSVF